MDDKYTVFVVDDSADDRERAIKTLQMSDSVCNVHVFENGDYLMAHLVSHGFYKGSVVRNMPLLILLDMHMPGTDGLGVLRLLRENPLTRDIPVVMLTSDTSGTTATAAYKLHVDAFLPKPIRLAPVQEILLSLRRVARSAV